jgi:hypothetical protein
VAVGKTEAGKKGMQITLDGDNLVIACGYLNMLDEALDEYIYESFFSKQGAVELTAYTPELDLTRVNYSKFGAVGDGKTDDFEAIKKTHEFASPLYLALGLLLFVFSLVSYFSMNIFIFVIAFVAVIVLAALVPVIYARCIVKNKK